MIYLRNAKQQWEREGTESGARDGCCISASSSVRVRVRQMLTGSLTPSPSVKQSWQQHVSCTAVFGGMTGKKACGEELS